MARVNVKYAEAHSAVFVGGKNFGLKLDPKRHTGLLLEYDQEVGEFYITWKDQEMTFPSSSLLCWQVGEVEARKGAVVPIKHGNVIKAQVSTPMDHVQGGPGAGKIRS